MSQTSIKEFPAEEPSPSESHPLSYAALHTKVQTLYTLNGTKRSPTNSVWAMLKEAGLTDEQLTNLTDFLPTVTPRQARLKFVNEHASPVLPQCPNCKQNSVIWSDSDHAWSPYCSVSCKNYALYGRSSHQNTPQANAKRAATMQARYGTDKPYEVPGAKEKAKATCQEHYGTDHQSKAPSVQAKSRLTCRMIHGTDHPMQDPAVQAKARATCQAHYGTDHPSQSPIVQAVTRANNQVKYAELGVVHPSQLQVTQDKMMQTCQDRYGVFYPQQSPVIRAKTQATLQQNYGVSNPSQHPVINAKARQTMLTKFGVHWSFQSVLLRAKSKATCQAHYGTDHPCQHPIVQLKIRQTRLENYYPQETLDKLRNKQFWEQVYYKEEKTLQVIAAELGVHVTTAGRYFANLGLEVRPNTLISTAEKDIKVFIEQYYSGPIRQQMTLGQIAREKGLLASSGSLAPSGLLAGSFLPSGQPNLRLSLDLYMPDLNLAIEHNGLYWHSTLELPDPLYHLKKTQSCEFLGIRLIHIWEDDWRDKRPLMEAKLRHILGLNNALPLCPTRKCTIEVPTKEEKRTFYEQNHIKGDGQGQVTYGLQNDGIWQAMITLKTTSTPGIYDLNRFATNINFRVPGAFSKLLKHFQKNHEYTEIFTYADRCWSQGNVYKQSGFTLDSKNPTTPPAFHGVEKPFLKRTSRRAYTHERLARRFPQTYDPNLTQLENMSLAGIPVVYDCGNYKYTLY